jgi:hypothetical protein
MMQVRAPAAVWSQSGGAMPIFAGSPDRRIAGSPDRWIAGSPDRRPRLVQVVRLLRAWGVARLAHAGRAARSSRHLARRVEAAPSPTPAPLRRACARSPQAGDAMR